MPSMSSRYSNLVQTLWSESIVRSMGCLSVRLRQSEWVNWGIKLNYVSVCLSRLRPGHRHTDIITVASVAGQWPAASLHLRCKLPFYGGSLGLLNKLWCPPLITFNYINFQYHLIWTLDEFELFLEPVWDSRHRHRMMMSVCLEYFCRTTHINYTIQIFSDVYPPATGLKSTEIPLRGQSFHQCLQFMKLY